ncbi:MAG: FAD-binding oxidoreductase [Deltaproteobacteria bacterium]|jgi:sarcosine oxidase subunit beta|nr:FAD-binding oxidoreductase [Deltaproteobacteria bacterium]
MFPQEAEIVVIGGGVVGSAVAYFLARAGKNVVLVEKGGRGGEASAANAAFVWSITRKAGIDIRLAMHSFDIHQQLQVELEMDFEYVRGGGLMIIEDKTQLPFVETHLQKRAKDGYPLEMIDADRVLELEPRLARERVYGAVYSPIDGFTNPIFLVLALNLEAQKLGAQLLHYTEVLDIGVTDGKVKSVITDKGTIKTQTVVNAAGSWGGFIGDMVGIQVPVSPFQLAMLVTEQLPPTLSHAIMGASYMVEEDTGKDEGLGGGLIMSQQAAGNLLIGASWRKTGYDRRTIQEEIELMARVNVRAMPMLKTVRIIRSYANFFPNTPDDLPILGRVDGVEGFIMACGHCGHGVGMGPGSGKLIQELICDGKTTIPLDEVNLSRFR